MSKTYSVDQFLDHALAGRDNSMRAGIEVDSGWDVPACIWATNMPKFVDGVQGKRTL